MEQIGLYYAATFVLAYLISSMLKILFATLKNKKFNLKYGFHNGGMPSMHTASITSITFAIGIVEGLSATFFLAVVISTIVMSDAVKVRKSIGEQGEALNTLLKKNKINVVYGHTINQVFVGAIIGFFVAILVRIPFGL
ncbi:MAG: divergent PAP2 family protein [Candidatus Woesearchaeota archaeon]